ncbi:hypothetical protein NLJ89_g3436 [Agrocybe chaxingu]|uniref:Uncharacterized protein n=1 Tax=Agrocybe chaxingu TaxID=84603 RepID=A0A9W8MWW2_9AGAR|nr:hypothetical protein NLJ89_g3436 [Agrocybe chaxingu]
MSSSGSQHSVGITHFYNSRNVDIEDSTFCARDDGSPGNPGGRISFGNSSQGMVIKGSMIRLTAGSTPGGYSSPPPPIPPPGPYPGTYGPPYESPYGDPYPPYLPYTHYGTYPPPPPPPPLGFYPNGPPIDYPPAGPWPGYEPYPAQYEPPARPSTESSRTYSSRRGHSTIPTPSQTMRHERRRKSPQPARRVSQASPPPRPASMSWMTPIDTPAPKNTEPLIPMRPMSPLCPLESVDDDQPSDSMGNLELRAEASESSNTSRPEASPSTSTSTSWGLSVDGRQESKERSKERSWSISVD